MQKPELVYLTKNYLSHTEGTRLIRVASVRDSGYPVYLCILIDSKAYKNTLKEWGVSGFEEWVKKFHRMCTPEEISIIFPVIKPDRNICKTILEIKTAHAEAVWRAQNFSHLLSRTNCKLD